MKFGRAVKRLGPPEAGGNFRAGLIVSGRPRRADQQCAWVHDSLFHSEGGEAHLRITVGAGSESQVKQG